MILFVGEDSSTVAVVAEQLAVFRILRALKMVEIHQDFHGSCFKRKLSLVSPPSSHR